MALYNIDNKVREDNPLAHEHIGVVIDVKDPLNINRVRVIIPTILDADNKIWLSRITPTFPGISYMTPRVGQKVRVYFKDNTLTSGVYGLDYVHKTIGLNSFQPGDYGFADLNSNMLRVRGSSTFYQTGSLNLKTNCLMVTGKIFSGASYTGSFSDGNGRIVNVQGGIITGISES